MDGKYGSFECEGSAYRIHTADIPRNWYNYLWNENYVTFVSQAGAGYGFAQDDMGRRIELVRDRSIFLLESGKHWGICGLPVEEEREEFSCVHDLGYSVVHTKNMASLPT